MLCIDGGGFRGLAVAHFLALCKDGRDLVGNFDLYAGTSTGGIIALALAAGIPPKQIRDWYLEWGPRIFRNRLLAKLRLLIPREWRRQYSNKPLQKALRHALHDLRLSELQKDVLIPAVDNDSADPIYFFNRRKPYTCVVAGMATTAAPSYFVPIRVNGHEWSDGGQGINNPTMQAWAECNQLWPDEEYECISIGTGKPSGRRRHPPFATAMLLRILSITLRASAHAVHVPAGYAYEGGYTRIDFDIERDLPMDDASTRAQGILIDAAEREYERRTGVSQS